MGAPLPRPAEQPSSPRRPPVAALHPTVVAVTCKPDARSGAGDLGTVNGDLVPDLCQESTSSMCPEVRTSQRAAFLWLRVSRWGLVGAVFGHLPGWVKATKMSRDSAGLLQSIGHGPRAERDTPSWPVSPIESGPGLTGEASQDGVHGSGISLGISDQNSWVIELSRDSDTI